jgi:DNA-binding protein HU-beta
MTKSELVDELSQKIGQTKSTTESMLDAFVEVVAKTLKENSEVKLVGFGTFSVSTRKARAGRNPQTGQEIQIPEKRVVSFKAGKLLRDAVSE